MSDERLRELERRWKESGGEVDLVAWLVARLRAGELPVGRVQMLAALDHEPARAALEQSELPEPAPGEWSRIRDLVLDVREEAQAVLGLEPEYLLPEPPEIARVGDWALRLEPWGDEVMLRAACAAAQAALPVFEAAAPDDRRPRAALAAVDACLRAPGRSHGGEAEAVARREALTAARALGSLDRVPGKQAPANDAACAAQQTAKLAELLSLAGGAAAGKDEEERAVTRIRSMVASRAVCFAAGAIGGEAAKQAVRDALAEWALEASHPGD